MSRDDWFRNTTWSDKIAAQFDAKLKRARLEKSSELMAFPVQQFKWNAAQALIAGARKQMSEAREFAKRALEAFQRSFWLSIPCETRLSLEGARGCVAPTSSVL
jgi:hypothetical protein